VIAGLPRFLLLVLSRHPSLDIRSRLLTAINTSNAVLVRGWR
jgi:hypothetical protein